MNDHLSLHGIKSTDDVVERAKGRDVTVEERGNRVILTNTHHPEDGVLGLPKTSHLSKNQRYQALLWLGGLVITGIFMYIVYPYTTCPVAFDKICGPLFGWQ